MSKPKSLDHCGETSRMLLSLGRRRPLTQVFRDWVECSALAISNGVDKTQYDAREERYLRIINSYEKDERMLFPEMFGRLVLLLEETGEDVFMPIMAKIDMQGNARMGQFFTPWAVSLMMAKMTFGTGDLVEEAIKDHGFITAMEPACGAGGMVLAMARALEDQGVNYQQHLHVTAIDIDPMCVHMCYLQASLMGIPAIVYCGNTMSGEMRDYWLTPMHVMGAWSVKLARYGTEQDAIARWHDKSLAQRVDALARHGLDTAHMTDERPPAALAEV